MGFRKYRIVSGSLQDPGANVRTCAQRAEALAGHHTALSVADDGDDGYAGVKTVASHFLLLATQARDGVCRESVPASGW